MIYKSTVRVCHWFGRQLGSNFTTTPRRLRRKFGIDGTIPTLYVAYRCSTALRVTLLVVITKVLAIASQRWGSGIGRISDRFLSLGLPNILMIVQRHIEPLFEGNVSRLCFLVMLGMVNKGFGFHVAAIPPLAAFRTTHRAVMAAPVKELNRELYQNDQKNIAP